MEILIIIIIIIIPFVIETSGACNAQAIELTQKIGRRTTAVMGDPLETIQSPYHDLVSCPQRRLYSDLSTL